MPLIDSAGQLHVAVGDLIGQQRLQPRTSTCWDCCAFSAMAASNRFAGFAPRAASTAGFSRSISSGRWPGSVVLLCPASRSLPRPRRSRAPQHEYQRRTKEPSGIFQAGQALVQQDIARHAHDEQIARSPKHDSGPTSRPSSSAPRRSVGARNPRGAAHGGSRVRASDWRGSARCLPSSGAGTASPRDAKGVTGGGEKCGRRGGLKTAARQTDMTLTHCRQLPAAPRAHPADGGSARLPRSRDISMRQRHWRSAPPGREYRPRACVPGSCHRGRRRRILWQLPGTHARGRYSRAGGALRQCRRRTEMYRLRGSRADPPSAGCARGAAGSCRQCVSVMSVCRAAVCWAHWPPRWSPPPVQLRPQGSPAISPAPDDGRERALPRQSHRTCATSPVGRAARVATHRPIASVLSCSDARVGPGIRVRSGTGRSVRRARGGQRCWKRAWPAWNTPHGSLVRRWYSCSGTAAAARSRRRSRWCRTTRRCPATCRADRPAEAGRARGAGRKPGEPAGRRHSRERARTMQAVTAAQPLLAEMIADGKVKVAGGVYDIATGGSAWPGCCSTAIRSCSYSFPPPSSLFAMIDRCPRLRSHAWCCSRCCSTAIGTVVRSAAGGIDPGELVAPRWFAATRNNAIITMAIVLNLAVLGLFKYANFFAGSVGGAHRHSHRPPGHRAAARH